MQILKKLKIPRYLVSDHTGQAAIEYVLLLVVSVSLLFAFKGVVTGIDKFMYSYMGEYISCLMEYGELPSRDVQNSDLDQHKAGGSSGKVCDSKFQPFNLKAGKAASGSSSASASNNAASSKNNSKTANVDSTSAAKNAVGQNGSFVSESRSASSPYDSGKVQRSSGPNFGNTADNASSYRDDGKVKTIEQEDSDASLRARLSGAAKSNRTNYERSRYRALTGKELETLDPKNRMSRAPTSKILTTIEEQGRIGPRRSIFNPPEKKAKASAEEDNDQMNFSRFMKWLIIAAMGIAIFLFFGSQVMSFMNSQEK